MNRVQKKQNNKKGFTLLELIAVLVILAIISMIAVPLFMNKSVAAKQIAHNENVRILFSQGQAYLVKEKVSFPQVNIIDDMVAKGYIKEIPDNPLGGAPYIVAVNDSGVITVTPEMVEVTGVIVEELDTIVPTVVITANTLDSTSESIITYTMEFSENIIEFGTEDVVVTNGTKGIFTAVDQKIYTLVVTNSGPCTQTVTVNEGVCTDEVGNNNVSGSKSIIITALIYNGTHNIPKLVTGMTPVKWVGTTETETISTDPLWYLYNGDIESTVGGTQYTADKWANVKLVDGSLFVWIPRYTYNIKESGGTSKIWIKYSNGTIDDTSLNAANSNTPFKVHPAFNFGGKQLTGIWVAKFEASNNGSGKVQVRPGIVSWTGIGVDAIFTACRAMQNASNPYGISTDTNVIDTHMMKNNEWAAVAYLTEAIRDRNEIEMNSDNNCYTGGSSTVTTVYGANVVQGNTGNVYAIYDLSGGAWEYAASYVQNHDVPGDGVENYDFGYLVTYANSLISAVTDYKNELTGAFDGTQETAYNVTSTQTDGMALHEIADSFSLTSTFQGYGDYQSFAYSMFPVFIRGGCYSNTGSAGVFAYMSTSGAGNTTRSFRPVLIGFE
ncbi:MAG: hypothetical protein A2Y18_07640 [Clostridiales bacterium GWD2_32_19]|nr:MAG: hypothetical protein A2Y18_07640 [Clostridiales bacterium GWD2_32_19]